MRELQRSILEAAGYRVETARDGQEGLDRVSGDDEIALVITDLEMPEMDGLELTKAIRARSERVVAARRSSSRRSATTRIAGAASRRVRTPTS